jgi:hypothetical protein
MRTVGVRVTVAVDVGVEVSPAVGVALGPVAVGVTVGETVAVPKGVDVADGGGGGVVDGVGDGVPVGATVAVDRAVAVGEGRTNALTAALRSAAVTAPSALRSHEVSVAANSAAPTVGGGGVGPQMMVSAPAGGTNKSTSANAERVPNAPALRTPKGQPRM